MSAKNENVEMRCEDCGLAMPESTGGRCPRCGACIDRGIDYCSALPAVSLVNPYEVQYREICDDVYEGRLSDSACGDFVVSMERLADDGDDMAQHFLGRYIYLGKDWKYMYELLEKFRADAMVDYFFRHEDVSFFDINLNAQYLLGEDNFHYYPLAGFCFLGHSENALGFPSTFKFGFNVGGGAEYNFSDKFKVYGELKYQIVSGWGRVIPSIGVMFAL